MNSRQQLRPPQRSDMNATGIPLKAPGSSPDVPPSDIGAVGARVIDASTRVPVLMFYTSAIAWLILGTLLGDVRFVQVALARSARRTSVF